MAAKRELIDSGNDKRFVRRDAEGRFKDVVDVGKSLAADHRAHGKTKVSSGEADRREISRDAKTGSFVTVRRAYEMPNGEKIVTVRRDIVDRAIGRKK